MTLGFRLERRRRNPIIGVGGKLLVPWSGGFVSIGGSKQCGFVQSTADQLQSYRKPLGRKAAGNRNRRQAGKIAGARQSQKRQPNIFTGSPDPDFFLIQGRSDYGQRWRQEKTN